MTYNIPLVVPLYSVQEGMITLYLLTQYFDRSFSISRLRSVNI